MIRFVMMALLVSSAAQAAEETKKIEIAIENYAFVPKVVSIPKGATVVWINKDESPHNIVATDKQFRSQPLDTNETYSHTFNEAGSTSYYCILHPHMTGTIEVTGP